MWFYSIGLQSYRQIRLLRFGRISFSCPFVADLCCSAVERVADDGRGCSLRFGPPHSGRCRRTDEDDDEQ